MNKEKFLRKFEHLSDKWMPLLGLQLSAKDDPVTETQPITVQASFGIDYTYSSREVGGINRYNCNNQSEVTSLSNEVIAASTNGNLNSVNEILLSELSKNSLFSSVHKNKLPIQTFEYSCLITCTTCSGRGSIRCYNCGGSGTVDEWRNEIVGYNEYKDQRGYVTRREPIYENRRYKVNCSSCGGSGKRRCSTCHGDGENTYIETVDVFSKLTKRNIEWSTFSETDWTNKYLNEVLRDDKEKLELQSVGNWNLSDQLVQAHNNATFTVKLPGTITACDCNVTITSDYSTSSGHLKMLGALIYDCDYVFSEHTYQAAHNAIKLNKLDVKSLSPLTSSNVFNTCGASTDGGETISPCDLISKNMISQRSSKEMHKLMSILQTKFTKARSKISVRDISLKTILMYFLISLSLFLSSYVFGNGVYESFKILNLLTQLIDVLKGFSLSPRYLTDISIALLILFLPSIFMMMLFGAKKNWTTKRILRWYWISAPLIAVFALVFVRAPSKISSMNLEVLLSSMPFADVLILSSIGGIFLARKKSWGIHEKQAELYDSEVLMKKLDYKE